MPGRCSGCWRDWRQRRSRRVVVSAANPTIHRQTHTVPNADPRDRPKAAICVGVCRDDAIHGGVRYAHPTLRASRTLSSREAKKENAMSNPLPRQRNRTENHAPCVSDHIRIRRAASRIDISHRHRFKTRKLTTKSHRVQRPAKADQSPSAHPTCLTNGAPGRTL